MAEPLSAIAAVASLADISFRMTRGIFSLLTALSTASAEIRYLQRHLRSLERSVVHLRSVLELYSKSNSKAITKTVCSDVEEELKLCIEDLEELGKLLQDPATRPVSTFNRFGVRVKSVWQEKSVAKLTEKLERRQMYFSNALSTIGRQNDIELRLVVDQLRKSQNKATQSITRNTERVGLLARDLNYAHRLIMSDQRRISRQLTQKVSSVRNTVILSHAKSDKQQGYIGAGLRATRKQLVSLQSDTTAAKESISQLTQHVHTRIDQLDETLKGLNGLCFNISRDKKDNSVTINGSAERAAASLHLVFSNLPKIFASLNHQADAFLLSGDDMHWLQLEFKSLLAAVDFEASRELRGIRKGAGFTDKRRPTQPTGIQQRFEASKSNHTSCEYDGDSNRNASPGDAVELRETKAVIDLYIGKFTIFISERCPTPGSLGRKRYIDGVRLLFFPRVEVCVCGFAASSTYDWQGQTRMYPMLSTFGILQDTEPIWRFIEVGDILNVRRALGLRKVHPNDRDDKYGNSLLGWAAWNHQREICALLVREGADALNCDSEGYSALSIFYRAAFQSHSSGSGLVDTTRTLISACGGDIVEHDKHIDWKGTTTGIFSHGILHRAILEMFPAWIDTDRAGEHYESLELLLQSGAEPNERNGWGRTPLLTAAFQVRLISLPRVMQLLLRYGADPLLVDGDGEGILHRLLYAFGSCGIRAIDSAWVESMVQILVSLLQAGCDPNLKKSDGWTPSDSALSPSAWMIWCESLVKAGYDPAEVIQKDDSLDGAPWSEAQIAKQYRTTLQMHRDRQQSELHSETHVEKPNNCCRICGECSWWVDNEPPFDFVGTYLNPSLRYHQQLYNHANGQFCPNYFFDYPCSFLEHEHRLPLSPEPGQLSWRKHIALRMWKDDLLVLPMS